MQKSQRDTIDLSNILKLVAPGTPLREGIDNVLRAKTGGLIVIGYNEKMQGVVDGGFSINCPFSPANLYELAKMDGAIILSESCNRILFANTQLVPQTTVPSTETGMRHRTAERVAKQTGNLVIAISQRRNVITLYRDAYRYALKDIGVILTKANQAIQTLEKYKSVLDQSITDLGALEIEELVTYQEVIQVIHRVVMVLRIRNEILNYVNELGTEGRLIRLQMTELLANIEEEAALLVLDYCNRKEISDIQEVLGKLQQISDVEVRNDGLIMKVLGFTNDSENEDGVLEPRGFRILKKIPRLPFSVIKKLIDTFDNLNTIMKASTEELEKVEGIGEVRALKIKNGLNRIQEQLFLDRNI